MHAHERRTLDAYHACLTDFTFTSPVTSSLLTAILLAILDFYSEFSLHDSSSRRQVLSSSSSAECLICMTVTIRSSEQAHKHNRIYHSKVPSRFQQRSFFMSFIHPATGFWHLPIRGNIPPRPDLYLLFLLFTSPFSLARLASFPTLLTQIVTSGRSIALEALSSINERTCPFGIGRKRATKQASTATICTDGIGTGTVVLEHH